MNNFLFRFEEAMKIRNIKCICRMYMPVLTFVKKKRRNNNSVLLCLLAVHISKISKFVGKAILFSLTQISQSVFVCHVN